MRGRVALVTGGSGGIGAALVARLVDAGATVAVHYAHNRPEQTGAGTFQADLRDPEAPERLVDEVEAQLGPVDVLAANAGMSRPAPYEDVDGAAFDETLAVNLRAPFLLARRCCRGCASGASAASSSPRRWPG
jgi:3-oxoacyl-[acyl-carrier protein] reductase